MQPTYLRPFLCTHELFARQNIPAEATRLDGILVVDTVVRILIGKNHITLHGIAHKNMMIFSFSFLIVLLSNLNVIQMKITKRF